MQKQPTNVPETGQPPADTGEVVPFPKLGAKEKPFPARNSEALRDVLVDFAVDVQFNVRSRLIERAELGPIEEDDAWQHVDDRWLAMTRERIESRYWYQSGRGTRPLKWGREPFYDTLNALVYYRQRDPFRDWLDLLPPWDGHERLEGLLCNMFGCAWSPLAEWASTFIFLGTVQRTYQPGCKLDQIVVLIGEQGLGKSALLREALPPEVPGLYSDGLRWDVPDKEKAEATRGKAIVEASEMAGRRRAEIEGMKTYIARQDDNVVRMAYARAPEPTPRRFIIVATTNDPNDLPNDPTGLRRFVPVVLRKSCNVEQWMAEERENLWAEALAMFRAGRRANLPRDLFAMQREHAEAHRDRDDVLEDAVAELHTNGPEKLATIITLLGEAGHNATPQRVGKALKNAGWAKRHTKEGSRWVRLQVNHDEP